MPRRAPSTACHSGSTLPASCNQLRTCMAPTAMRTADAGPVSLVAVGLDACRSRRNQSRRRMYGIVHLAHHHRTNRLAVSCRCSHRCHLGRGRHNPCSRFRMRTDRNASRRRRRHNHRPRRRRMCAHIQPVAAERLAVMVAASAGCRVSSSSRNRKGTRGLMTCSRPMAGPSRLMRSTSQQRCWPLGTNPSHN